MDSPRSSFHVWLNPIVGLFGHENALGLSQD